MSARLVPLGCLLTLSLLAGCGDGNAPTTADNEVEFVVLTSRPHASWYAVTVLDTDNVVRLQANVTLAEGRQEIGDLPPGRYQVFADDSSGLRDSRTVDVTTRNVVYVNHDQADVLRITVTTLGE